MIKRISAALGIMIVLSIPMLLQGADIFPYNYTIEELENGLRIVSIPLANPHIISYYTIVRSGSRNEIEPGKSGFAHFFEHMMFKGTQTVPREAYDHFLTELGAGTNGFTSDDRTVDSIVHAVQRLWFRKSRALGMSLM